MSHPSNTAGLSTLAIHAGDEPDPVTGSVADIVMSSTYVVKEKPGFSAHDLGEETPFIYTRWGNPTVDGLQRKMSALEGTQATLCFASGMAATAAVFFSFLSAGDHLIISDVSYAGVAELARDTLPRFGIEVALVDMSDLEALAAAIRPNTRLIHTETPVNPLVRLTDLGSGEHHRQDSRSVAFVRQHLRVAGRDARRGARRRPRYSLADEICRRSWRRAWRFGQRHGGTDLAPPRRSRSSPWRHHLARSMHG